MVVDRRATCSREFDVDATRLASVPSDRPLGSGPLLWSFRFESRCLAYGSMEF